MPRTRIKICGLTREADVDSAVAAGADAIGLVFYAASPRHVPPSRAAELARRLPPLVSAVGLFVNAEADEVRRVLAEVPLQLLQFHGDETPAYCAQFGFPYLKAARVRPGLNLVEYAQSFAGSARGMLLDAFVEGYGGAGQTFDWSLIPQSLPLPVLLSGGLTPANVADAVRRVRPWAVDVSSGVEQSRGIKDAAKIAAFVAGVREADV